MVSKEQTPLPEKPAKPGGLTFRGEVHDLEFTEEIANMADISGKRVKTRDKELVLLGKWLFKKFPELVIRKNYIKLRKYPVILSQAEIDMMLCTPEEAEKYRSIPFFRRIADSIKSKIGWKLTIHIHGVHLEIPVFVKRPKTRRKSPGDCEEIEGNNTGRSEVLSPEEIDALLAAINAGPDEET